MIPLTILDKLYAFEGFVGSGSVNNYCEISVCLYWSFIALHNMSTSDRLGQRLRKHYD